MSQTQTAPKFFITYSHQDSAFAHKLTDALRANGLDGFFDAYSIRAGDDFAKRIAHGLEECDVYVPVLSPAALESPWCEREINAAIALSMERGRGGRPRIVPVICRPCHIPVLLRSLLYIDFVGRYDNALDELLTKGFLLETRPPVSSEPTRPGSEIRPLNIPRPTSSTVWSGIVGWAMILIPLLIVGIWGVPLAIKWLAPPTVTPVPPARAQGPTNTPVAPTRALTNTPVPPTPAQKPTDAYGVGSTKISADGATMVYVPAGEFVMGSSDGDRSAHDDEKPQHSVYVDAFWIDKFEVANALFKKCVDAGKCSAPPDNKSSTRRSYYGNPQFDNYPMINVTWDMADVFCTWAVKHLPTEAQWEKAARGTDKRIYPWGNTFDSNRLNWDGGLKGDTLPVGSYLGDASPYGAMDMAGNVAEWVADWYDANYYKSSVSRNPKGPDSGQYRVLRGGAWSMNAIFVRTASRLDSIGDWGSAVGFRCVE